MSDGLVVVKACQNEIAAMAAQAELADAGIDSVIIAQGSFVNPEIQFSASVGVAVAAAHQQQAIALLFPPKSPQ